MDRSSDGVKSPEFDLARPAASAAAVLRAIFLAPRAFYAGFDASGPVKEPTAFVLLVSAVSGVLSIATNLVLAPFSETGVSLPGVAALNLAFFVLSPVLVGAAAGAYLLSVRAFVDRAAGFRGVYRMLAYAYGAMILFWVPGVGAFVFAYAGMVLALLGVLNVYRPPFLTVLIATLAGFIPVSLAYAYLLGTANGLVAPG